jgi:hypothetical protein
MAQTLKFGNGTWATKKGSTLAYNDEGGNFKPLPFTYTGAGKGTRVNKEGLIEVVENDRPRIDYTDSEDGVFLLEKAATNSLLQSNQFDTTWTSTNATVTSGQIGVGGSVDAWELEKTATNGYIRHIGVSIVNGSISIYAKKGSSNWFRLGSSSGNIEVYFDLNNGIIGNKGNLVSTANITDMGDGWYRCSYSYTGTATGVYLYPADSNGDTSGTSGSVYIQYAQLEVGNVSSYIPTQGTIQTRVQETASGSGNSEVFNSEQGILYFEGSGENDNTFNYISLSDGGTTNYAAILYTDTDNQIIYRYYVGGSGVQIVVNSINVTNFNKFIIKYKENDFAIWINGFEVGTASSGSLNPSGTFTELAFARGGSNNTPFYGKTKEIAYYDEVLTDLELETLTSYRTWESMVKELNLNVIYNG